MKPCATPGCECSVPNAQPRTTPEDRGHCSRCRKRRQEARRRAAWDAAEALSRRWDAEAEQDASLACVLTILEHCALLAAIVARTREECAAVCDRVERHASGNIFGREWAIGARTCAEELRGLDDDVEDSGEPW